MVTDNNLWAFCCVISYPNPSGLLHATHTFQGRVNYVAFQIYRQNATWRQRCCVLKSYLDGI